MRWAEHLLSWYALVPLALVLLFFPPAFLDAYNRIDLVLALLVVWIVFWTVRATRGWRGYDRAAKERYFKRVILFASVVVTLGLAWVLSNVLAVYYHTENLGIHGANAP